MIRFSLYIFFCLFVHIAFTQGTRDTGWWHGIERTVHYQPEGTDFVCRNGTRRFTRALYGSNTAFRVEAGDLPEFALYMPGMGGNLKFALVKNDSSKWLISADSIIARYRPGSMLYDIADPLLGKGGLHLAILALADAEGLVVRAQFENVTDPVQLMWAFGGATGKKFSRDGDMGPDPESSFYLKPEYCRDNRYRLSSNSFLLHYGTGLLTEPDPYVNRDAASDSFKAVKAGKEQLLTGLFPPGCQLRLVDAAAQSTPLGMYQSKALGTPAVAGKMDVKNDAYYYFVIQKPADSSLQAYANLAVLFQQAEAARKLLADRVKVITPDPYINTLGGALGIAADAIWESPSYLHGSIGWRMRLNGWRGPYVADPLGWHDRAHSHYESYALSQVTTPPDGPVVPDTALHLARSLEKIGTSVYSSGYISRNPGGDIRPHHYDMNLVFIDGLFRHFKWTGDLVFAKKMWPVIQRHLAWEKRNFDPDNDGLYDAYAAIWASDALQYSGGAVTHSSAYNYKANREAALIASMIGEDPRPYQAEASRILTAINIRLWMPAIGSYAEYRDLLGMHQMHPAPAVWTIYHSIDSDVPDAFRAYESTRYIDANIPHIPVRAKGLVDDGYYTISTSNWMPYDWSLNNVAMAEVMHTSLAYWQAGRHNEAFKLWKSELISSMYLGGSPGNIVQISAYDAARGEAYRDFADPIAMTARSLVEGLFGILPDALKGELTIKPGFPDAWNFASISIPDMDLDFKRNKKEDIYKIVMRFPKSLALQLIVAANRSDIGSITVNGKAASWRSLDTAIGQPLLQVFSPPAKSYEVKIRWQGSPPERVHTSSSYVFGSSFQLHAGAARILRLYDPEGNLELADLPKTGKAALKARLIAPVGSHTSFVQLQQGAFKWWQPLHIKVIDPVELYGLAENKDSLRFSIRNLSTFAITVEPGFTRQNQDFTSVKVPAGGRTEMTLIANNGLVPGTNPFQFVSSLTRQSPASVSKSLLSWKVVARNLTTEEVDLSALFNDKVTRIFRNQYLSPRPKVATLQLPTQGIGDWTHPLKTADIDDRGLRKLAGEKGEFMIPQGIPFRTPSDTLKNNILFTSQWDNYPRQAIVPLKGKASHAYFLLAGSTNPMQSRIQNGSITIEYLDGSAEKLPLINPQSWWPIEQDYMEDGYAFQINAPRPVRVHLKTGLIVSDLDNSMAKYAGKMIEGGAATVLDLPLDPNKTLKKLTLQTLANDVVIGLMSITLVR